jgi:hypothetical protein
MKNYGFIMAAVTELVVTIILFLIGGHWADGHFKMGSLFVAIGAVLGSGIGFTRLIMRLQKIKDD